jgi:anti-repressor protein
MFLYKVPLSLNYERKMRVLVSKRDFLLGGEESLGVDARELWAFLEVKTRFGDWIVRKIEEADFRANQDFVIILKNENNSAKGRPVKEYILSLDSAKHFAMLEKTEKGRQVRQYFIECEKAVRTEPTTTKQVADAMKHGSLVLQIRAM